MAVLHTKANNNQLFGFLAQDLPLCPDQKECKAFETLFIHADPHRPQHFFGGGYSFYTKEDCGRPIPIASTSRDDFIETVRQLPADKNVYITKNPSKLISHKTANLYGLRNIVVDIDAHGFSQRAYAYDLSCALINTLLDEFAHGELDFPAPQTVVKSGRGVHLYWSFNNVNARFESIIRRYRETAKSICCAMEQWLRQHPEFDGFSVDMATSVNPSGLIRLPGSNNMASVNELGEHKAHVEVYRTSLTEGLYELTALEKAFAKFSVVLKKSKAKQQHGTALKELKRLNSVRVKRLIICMQRHYPNGVPCGLRDNFLFVLYNLLLKSMSVERAYHIVSKTNQTQCEIPFEETTLHSYLSASSCIVNEDGTIGYKLSDESLCARLNLSVTEFRRSWVCLQRAKRIRQQAKADRRATKQSRIQLAVKYHQEGYSFVSIARKLGITRQTASVWVRTFLKRSEKARRLHTLVMTAQKIRKEVIKRSGSFSACVRLHMRDIYEHKDYDCASMRVGTNPTQLSHYDRVEALVHCSFQGVKKTAFV